MVVIKHLTIFSILMCVLHGCASNGVISHKGTIKVNVLYGTEFERVIVFSKDEIEYYSIDSDSILNMKLGIKLVDSLDKMNLGAQFFEMIFFDENEIVELSLVSSASPFASIAGKNQNRPSIQYIDSLNTYFPRNTIKVNLKEGG